MSVLHTYKYTFETQTSNMHTILTNLRSIRIEKGLSQEQMAKRMEISQSAYTRFENGSVRTDIRILEKAANVLLVTMCDIHYHHDTEMLARRPVTLEELSLMKQRIKLLELGLSEKQEIIKTLIEQLGKK